MSAQNIRPKGCGHMSGCGSAVYNSPVVVVVAMTWSPGGPSIPNTTAFILRRYGVPPLSPVSVPVVLLPGNVTLYEI